MTRCNKRNERFIVGSVFGDGAPARILWALHLAAVRLLGPRVVRGRPGSPGSDGASPYHLERRFMPRSDNIEDRLTLRAPAIRTTNAAVGARANRYPEYTALVRTQRLAKTPGFSSRLIEDNVLSRVSTNQIQR
jgi:hypothetical protein